MGSRKQGNTHGAGLRGYVSEFDSKQLDLPWNAVVVCG